MTLAEYRAKHGGALPTTSERKPSQPRKNKQQELALLVLVRRLEKDFRLRYQGRWTKALDVRHNGIITEFPFALERKRRYRFDLAIPGRKVAMEIHGGAYVVRPSGGMGGAHHTIQGRARDMAKGNLASVMGWIVIEVSPKELADGTAYRWLAEALTLRGES